MKSRAALYAGFLLVLALAGTPSQVCAADTNSAAATKPDDNNSQEVLRAYLQLQEQLHATQLAIEQNQKEAREAAARSAESVDARLQTLEHAITSQQTRAAETMQSSNRVMVIVAGSFAVMGFIAMLLMAYFQWRTVNGLAHLSANLPGFAALGPGSPLAALGPGDAHLMSAGAARQTDLRLADALEQLEKRLYQLEHASTALPAQEAAEPAPGAPGHSNGQSERPNLSNGGSPFPATEPATSPRPEVTQLTGLLDKGQSMLGQDQPAAALACFEEALALAPANAEALVKKGAALERMQRLPEAIACYDQAIAADGSLTIAYLHKGGLCNRLERYTEALECYEQALRTQEKMGRA